MSIKYVWVLYVVGFCRTRTRPFHRFSPNSAVAVAHPLRESNTQTSNPEPCGTHRCSYCPSIALARIKMTAEKLVDEFQQLDKQVGRIVLLRLDCLA